MWASTGWTATIQWLCPLPTVLMCVESARRLPRLEWQQRGAETTLFSDPKTSETQTFSPRMRFQVLAHHRDIWPSLTQFPPQHAFASHAVFTCCCVSLPLLVTRSISMEVFSVQ